MYHDHYNNTLLRGEGLPAKLIDVALGIGGRNGSAMLAGVRRREC
jgi:hypothetical protein